MVNAVNVFDVLVFGSHNCISPAVLDDLSLGVVLPVYRRPERGVLGEAAVSEGRGSRDTATLELILGSMLLRELSLFRITFSHSYSLHHVIIVGIISCSC